MQCIYAAYCYICHWGCLCVGHTDTVELCKNGWTNYCEHVLELTHVGPRNHVLDGVHIPHGKSSGIRYDTRCYVYLCSKAQRLLIVRSNLWSARHVGDSAVPRRCVGLLSQDFVSEVACVGAYNGDVGRRGPGPEPPIRDYPRRRKFFAFERVTEATNLPHFVFCNCKLKPQATYVYIGLKGLIKVGV